MAGQLHTNYYYFNRPGFEALLTLIVPHGQCQWVGIVKQIPQLSQPKPNKQQKGH